MWERSTESALFRRAQAVVPSVGARRKSLSHPGSALLCDGGTVSKARWAGGGPRGLTKHPYVVALSCLLLGLTLLLSGCSGAVACGQGLPTVEPSRAAPGEAFVVRGGGFGGGCDDSNRPSLEEPRQRGIRIEMRQEGRTWDLATVDANADYKVEATLAVPEDAEPGRAVVVVNTEAVYGDGDRFVPLEVPFEVLAEPGGSG